MRGSIFYIRDYMWCRYMDSAIISNIFTLALTERRCWHLWRRAYYNHRERWGMNTIRSIRVYIAYLWCLNMRAISLKDKDTTKWDWRSRVSLPSRASRIWYALIEFTNCHFRRERSACRGKVSDHPHPTRKYADGERRGTHPHVHYYAREDSLFAYI